MSKFSWDDHPIAAAGAPVAFSWDDHPAIEDQAPLQSNPIGAAIEGLGQGGTAGYLPQIQAALGSVVPDPNAALDARLRAAGFTVDQPKDTYLSLRDENIARQEALAKSNPKSYYGGMLAGGAVTAPIAEIGATKALPTIINGSKLGRAAAIGAGLGAIQNPGDVPGEIAGLQGLERAKNAGIGMIAGPVVEKAVGAVGNIGSKLTGAGEEASSLAEKTALNAAGAQKPQIKALNKRGRADSVAKFIIDEDIVPPGAEAGDILENAKRIKSSAGKEIGNVFDEIAKTGKAGTFSRKEVAQGMRDSLLMDENVGGSLDAEKVLGQLDQYIANFESKKGPATAKELLELKGKFDGRINYSKKSMELPELQQGYENLRSTLNEAINNRAESLSNEVRGDLGKRLKDANRRYGLASSVNDIAENKAAQEGNNFFSLRDTLLGAAAAGGRLAHGDPTGVMYGIGGAMASKAARKYGPQASFSMLNSIGSGLKSAGEMVPDIAMPAGTGTAVTSSLLNSKRNKRLKALEE